MKKGVDKKKWRGRIALLVEQNRKRSESERREKRNKRS